MGWGRDEKKRWKGKQREELGEGREERLPHTVEGQGSNLPARGWSETLDNGDV